MKSTIFTAILIVTLCIGLTATILAEGNSLKLEIGDDVRPSYIVGAGAVFGIGANGKIYSWFYDWDDETTAISDPEQILENVKNPVQLAYYHGHWNGIFILNTDGDVFYYSGIVSEGAKATGKTILSNIVQIAADNLTAVALKEDGTIWIADQKYKSFDLPGDGFQFSQYEGLSDVVYITKGNQCVLAVDASNNCYKVSIWDDSEVEVAKAAAAEAIDSSYKHFVKLDGQC